MPVAMVMPMPPGVEVMNQRRRVVAVCIDDVGKLVPTIGFLWCRLCLLSAELARVIAAKAISAVVNVALTFFSFVLLGFNPFP